MPKVVDHDAYRDDLLSRCFWVFAQYGYDKMTMRQIAKVLGVSTGTLYHYFPNKQAIIKALFDWVMRTNVGDVKNRVRDIDVTSMRIDIAKDFWKQNAEYYRHVMLLAFDLLRNTSKEEHEPVFKSFADYYKNAMVEIFKIPYEFSELLFILFLGSVFHSIVTPQSFSYDNAVNTIVTLIREAVKENGCNKAPYKQTSQ
ncbi:MAG: TetR/AcrR family transcriptional regulator [Spirochaetes bacterium]|nr:TetR/AcrR family transcriptional regulator [Spirochaetota bacterium]